MPTKTSEATVATEETVKPRKGRRRGEVTIFPNWCKGCGLCVEFCPQNVLDQADDGRVIVTRPEACIACRWCELHCPDFAIFVTEIEPEEDRE